MEINKIYLGDCLEIMKSIPDKSIDLVLTDPPYGIGRANNNKTIGKNKSRKNSLTIRTDYKNNIWDNSTPDKIYFDEIIRISKHQIIWGANYFIDKMPYNSKCWLIWDKVDTIPTYSDGEMAWTNFDKPLKIIPLIHSGFKRGQKIGKDSKIIYNIPFSGAMDIHPTQKPIKLFEWILHNYSNEGDTVLDPFAGSFTTAIACLKSKRNYICIEKEPKYFELGKKRIERHLSQQTLDI